MLLTDYWMLDGFLLRHPPTDVLVAAYLGVKTPEERGKPRKVSLREAARMNSSALDKMPIRRNPKSLAQMPPYLRSPEKMAAIEKMKAEWANG